MGKLKLQCTENEQKVVCEKALDGDSCSNFTASYLASRKKLAMQKLPVLCSMSKIACVKWKATNIALGQYWFLLLLYGFVPPGPGQYGYNFREIIRLGNQLGNA